MPTPAPTRLDHLVVAATDLDSGVAAMSDRLGVPFEPGGRHADFGTHNALLSLGPDAYLEVVAVDAGAPAPPRPRFFELDTPAMQRRLTAGPALVHWVAAVGSRADLDGLPHVLELSRGENRWALTVPADGSLAGGGVVPSFIAWHTPPPATSLPDRGVRLASLDLRTDDDALLTEAPAWADLPGVLLRRGAPELSATLRTPAGDVVLGDGR